MMFSAAGPIQFLLALQLDRIQLHDSMKCTKERKSSARVDNDLGATLRVELRELGKADVVANANAQAARVSVHDRQALPWRQRLRFLEGHAPRDVYVEQVHLPAHDGSVQTRMAVDIAIACLSHDLITECETPDTQKQRPNDTQKLITFT